MQLINKRDAKIIKAHLLFPDCIIFFQAIVSCHIKTYTSAQLDMH